MSLLTLVSFVILSSTFIKKIITEREGSVMLQNIEYFTGSLDSYLQSVEKSAQILAYNPKVQERLTGNVNRLSGPDRIQAYSDISDQLHQLMDRVYGTEAIFLVDPYDNVFDLNIGVNISPSYFLSPEFKAQGWFDLAEKSNSDSVWSFVHWREQQTSIVMFKPIYNRVNLQPIGHLVVSISPSILENYLTSSNLGDGSNSIVDSNGFYYSTGGGTEPPHSLDRERLKNGKGYYELQPDGNVVAYSQHGLTNWIFIHSIPQGILLKSLKSINNLWFSILAVSLVVMLVSSLFIARTISMPVRKMVQLLRVVERGNLNVKFNALYRDELGDLGRAFNDMIDKVREGMPLVREKFVRSLLEGSFNEADRVIEEKRMGFRLSAESFQVVIMYAQGEHEKETFDRAENVVHKFETGGDMMTFSLQANQLGLIFGSGPEQVLETVKTLLEALKTQCGITAFAFFGNSYEQLNFIKTSFEEAKALVKYRVSEQMDDSERLHFYGDSWKNQYPESFENKLVYYMEEGDYSSCETVMGELIEYARSNQITPGMMSTFMLALYHHWHKISIKSGHPIHRDGNWLRHVDEQLSTETLEKNGRDFLAHLKEHMTANRPKAKKMSANITRSLQIIQEEYSNQGLSVDSVSGSLGLNGNYFSQLFKKEVGVGFAEYVGSIRMEQAKQLLAEPSIKIKEVAVQVGFADPHYFGVWFKEWTGLSPSQYRKQLWG